MSDRRPTFLSTLSLELKVRLCAAGVLLLLVLFGAVPEMAHAESSGPLFQIASLLGIYVIGGEFIGLLAAQIFGEKGLSLIASVMAYGLDNSSTLRWLFGILLIGAFVYAGFFSPNSPPWFDR